MRRREFIQFVTALTAGGTALGTAAAALAQEQGTLSRETIVQAERIAGLSFTEAQREMILPVLQSYVQNMQAVRAMPVPPLVAPATHFIADVDGAWTPRHPKHGEA
ncbi:MAG: hypothetical protein HXY20_01255 [Acidobacteria bacterium]|nr:hypothetical protein [Acidobacteriota bacterium]